MTQWDDAENRVEKAHELYERGRWEEALDELKAAIAINPYNGSWFFNLGLTYDALDRFDEAIVAYRRAVEIDPDDVEVLSALGHDCNRAGNYDEAIRFFQRVEALDASYEPGYCNRIVSYTHKGDHEKAEEMFFLARQYKDRCPICYYNIGHSLFARAFRSGAVVLAAGAGNRSRPSAGARAHRRRLLGQGPARRRAPPFHRGASLLSRRSRCPAGPG